MEKRQRGSAACQQFEGIGALPQQVKMRRVYTGALLAPICKKRKERIKFILSYLEVKKHHYGWDTMDFNDNVRKDFNYG